MARNFIAASSQLLSRTAGALPTAAYPLTLACWFRAASGLTGGSLSFSWESASGDSMVMLGVQSSNVYAAASANGGAGQSGATTTTSITTGVWQHACGTFASQSSRAAYLGGAGNGADATDVGVAGTQDEFYVGVGDNQTGVFWNGQIAEVAVWSVVLTDAEILLLAQGVLPPQVRPQSLAAYWPLREPGTVWEFDRNPWARRRHDLTVSGATPADHPDGVLLLPRKRQTVFAPSGASAAITGTATAGITEADVVAGGKTVIITLSGDTFVASGATFNAIRQDIINGMDSAQAEAHGWDAEVKAKIAVTDVVRTSATVVTITLDAEAAYDVTATETITVTVPASALTGGVAITATPTFTVTPVVSGRLCRAASLSGLGGAGQQCFNPSLDGV